MSVGDATFYLRQAVYYVILMGGPLLLTALVVGLVIAILQATTSIQEQTLTSVQKIFAIMGMLAFLGGLGFSVMSDYTTELFKQISVMAR